MATLIVSFPLLSAKYLFKIALIIVAFSHTQLPLKHGADMQSSEGFCIYIQYTCNFENVYGYYRNGLETAFSVNRKPWSC